MTDAEIRTTLLLSLQRALLGAVPAALRAVTCGWTGGRIRLRFVFDGEIDDDDVESAQIVGTEVIADFPAGWTIEEEILRADPPRDLLDLAHPLCAYQRKETTAGGDPLP